MKLDRNKLAEEIQRRAAQKSSPLFNLNNFCFPKQLDFLQDGHRFKTAVCSRRAGKTIGIAADMINTCVLERDAICLYITLTRRSAQNIIWSEIKRLLQEYGIKAKTDDVRLRVVFLDTNSEIRLGGAKDESEIEKYRGWKLRKAYIDEAQVFRPYIKYFINDILLPALRDLRGQLIITGTPGPIPAGPFYEYVHSKNMSHHKWTAFDNPHMHNPPKLDLEVTLAEERLMKGIDERDPGYQRETYGLWIEDLNSLVFRFSPTLNITSSIPSDLIYVLGIDVGYVDSDAIAVLGYSLKEKQVYLVEEVITEKQNISALIRQIKQLQDKYKPVKMVMDAGGLGKKIQEEIKQRHGLHIEAAEKTRKLEFIELLNDDLRTAKFKALAGSRFEQDCALVQWDRSSPSKLQISDTYHTDIGDAVLYGWRECRHFYLETKQVAHDRNSNAFMDELEAREAQKLEDTQNGQDDWGVEADDLEDLFES